jgi:hypothetical protein
LGQSRRFRVVRAATALPSTTAVTLHCRRSRDVTKPGIGHRRHGRFSRSGHPHADAVKPQTRPKRLDSRQELARAPIGTALLEDRDCRLSGCARQPTHPACDGPGDRERPRRNTRSHPGHQGRSEETQIQLVARRCPSHGRCDHARLEDVARSLKRRGQPLTRGYCDFLCNRLRQSFPNRPRFRTTRTF